MLNWETWTRTSFSIKAIRVTSDRIHEIASTVGATVQSDIYKNDGMPFFDLIAMHPNGRTQTRPVYLGDWLTLNERGHYTSYTHKKYIEIFQKDVEQHDKFNTVFELIREAIDVQDPNAHAQLITLKIMDYLKAPAKS